MAKILSYTLYNGDKSDECPYVRLVNTPDDIKRHKLICFKSCKKDPSNYELWFKLSFSQKEVAQGKKNKLIGCQ